MPTALFSLSNKSNLIPFAKSLHDLGWKLLASGGTAKTLREAKLPVTDVADYTNSPEILGGRVKTLHPAIHGGILARDTDSDCADLKRVNAGMIDLVAVNLYPFQETIAKPNVTLDDAIENIDIGGVALIRAAAKNHGRVTVLCDPVDYELVLREIKENKNTTLETRRRLALKGFAHTAEYDLAISEYLAGQGQPAPTLTLRAYPVQQLRYGENPHQKATLYSWKPNDTPFGGEVLQGKELSYNNILDLDAAWRGAVSYQETAVVIVKHLSPCGIAAASSVADAYRLAFACDQVSAFGGVIAVNRPFDGDAATALGDLFAECIAAPSFTPEAREKLKAKKNLRLIAMPNLELSQYELRSVTRGILRQDLDIGDPSNTEWKIASKRQPTEDEMRSLKFAWIACGHVKSNAIVFAKGTATVGIGGGQPNRVDCVRIAATRAGEKSKGAVMASDAFFPFPDSVEVAAQSGITAVIAPGGSVRDEDSIAAADENNIAMIFTGVRHFRH
jgi:phosphoribosylaminoimidazolecarboxamide formyltransferase/IMP cyclohydrolase